MIFIDDLRDINLIVAKQPRRTIQWETQHTERVPRISDLLGSGTCSNKLTAIGCSLNLVLALRYRVARDNRLLIADRL